MSAWEEIERSLRRDWRRALLSRIFSRWIWTAPALLFAWTLFLHVCLRSGWWQPSPPHLFYGAAGALLLASAWALAALRGQSFPRFLRQAEERHGEIGLRAWRAMSQTREAVPIEGLFLESLRRRLQAIAPQQAPSFAIPRVSRLLFLASALGLLFLLLPWGGGLGTGIAPRPGMATESTSAEKPSAGDASTSPGRTESVKSTAGPGPQSPGKAPPPDRSREPKPHPVDPKYVPARESDGPKSWKETLLYELASPGDEGAPAPGASSIASAVEKWKRVAEETVRKEKLDAEEAQLVTRYFDKLRP